MPAQQIFCNSPWYELHIYWDGSLGFCCQASHKVYSDVESKRYRVQEMSIREWFNSDPMKQTRMAMFGDTYNTFCSKCYAEETFGETSRRHRSNQKSVIFTRSAFNASYRQSPGFRRFDHSLSNNGDYDGMPVDIHIDLGNHCNLACKMCGPQASSKIASQYARWGIKDAAHYIDTDWTRDNDTWRRVLTELAGIETLRNVHFMGGETLITKRFEDFVDFMAQQGKTNLNFSFVTNGTVYNDRLLDKLLKFSRIGIEVSIESLDATNSYQRQGTDQHVVMQNIDRYLRRCDNDKITVTLRPAISMLTIGSYPDLLRYAYENKLVIKSNLVTRPVYLDARVLPKSVKQQYLHRYEDLERSLSLESVRLDQDYNESDMHEFQRIIANQIQQCKSLLLTDEIESADKLRGDLVQWCRRWDSIYGYDAKKIYPELASMLEQYGY